MEFWEKSGIKFRDNKQRKARMVSETTDAGLRRWGARSDWVMGGAEGQRD